MLRDHVSGLTVLLSIIPMVATGDERPAQRAKATGPTTIAGVHVRVILKKLGVDPERADRDRLQSYRRIFDRIDRDADGFHSRKEFVEDGRYLTQTAREGIFRAADRDHDGKVSKVEYVENRIITDQAKAIFDGLDADDDGRLTQDEFLTAAESLDSETRAAVFTALDADGNGQLIVPEYLRTCGNWAREPRLPLKVFLLAGQSNMEGQAVVDLDHEEHYNSGRGTLQFLLKDPKRARRFRHLKTKAGEWAVRRDVHVWYQPERGKLKAGPLSIGYAVYPGRHHFGPELQFGHIVGDRFDEPVLLVKTAWGGKSLYKDFRPPSSGGEVGPCYQRMLSELREVLSHLGKYFPDHSGSTYVVAGFVWFQGWNDMIDQDAVAEYAGNLSNLIRDLRKELQTPKLPVVVAETGNCRNLRFREAQASVARVPEFAGTVAFVPTAEFLRPATESPNVGHGHHWFGNAESYFLIGEAMGRAMERLLDGDASTE